MFITRNLCGNLSTNSDNKMLFHKAVGWHAFILLTYNEKHIFI